jgi:hypothetical protein
MRGTGQGILFYYRFQAIRTIDAMSRDKLSKDDLPDSIKDNVEKALEKTGVSWDQLTENQKKQVIGGGKKARKIYKKYSK